MAQKKKYPSKKGLKSQVRHLERQAEQFANIIRTSKERIARYEDPEWVKSFVAKEQEILRKRILLHEQKLKDHGERLDQLKFGETEEERQIAA